ncbi:MAG: DUF58 domain-containing protein [bacterium]
MLNTLTPTRLLYLLLWSLLLLAGLTVFYPGYENAWWTDLLAVVAIVGVDALMALMPPPLTATRELPGSVALGHWKTIGIRIHNQGSRRRKLEAYDHYPSATRTGRLPLKFTLSGNDSQTRYYKLKALERGNLDFGPVQIRYRSPLRLWKRSLVLEPLPADGETRAPDTLKVYPNFTAVTEYSLLAIDNRISQMGVLKRPRRGQGQDFLQLREYRPSDEPRQIDWKTTSRQRKLISREYQDERDQQIVFLLDCGQRMRSRDGEQSHFDHALNALLLLSHVALKQGDAVGLGTFSGEPRWLPPGKSRKALTQLLNTVYDLQPSPQLPDYRAGITALLSRQKKRALVIVLTNLQDSEQSELLTALKLLQKKHLVLLASLREAALDEQLKQPVNDHPSALLSGAIHLYQQYRQQSFQSLSHENIISLDTTPQKLTTGLVNSYLDIKAAGRL